MSRVRNFYFFDTNYAVIIKAVDRTPNPEPLTLEQVKQLCTIIHETKYISMTSSNFIRGTDGLLHLPVTSYRH